jgi:hypothetical protein
LPIAGDFDLPGEVATQEDGAKRVTRERFSSFAGT